MIRRSIRMIFPVAPLALWLVTLPALAQQAPDPRVADIARAGVLRFAVPDNPILASKDPATGELRGITVDLARALATRIGVPAQPVLYPNPPALIEGLKTNAWDVAFFAIDPGRAQFVHFSPPYMEVDLTYLLPAGSPVQSVADVDRCGFRVAVGRGAQPDLVLTRTLKSATLVRADTETAAFELFRTGDADAFASNRRLLLRSAAQMAGSRVLSERFFANQHAIAVPAGAADRLAFVTEFIEQAKASGLVQQSIERHALEGVQVAPAALLSAEQQIRSLFERFILAQNAHDLTATTELLFDSPRFLWVTDTGPILGRQAVLKQLEGLFQGTWRLEARPEEAQITLLQEGTARLYIPAVLTRGAPSQAARTSRVLLNQVLVNGPRGWQIESLLLVPTSEP